MPFFADLGLEKYSKSNFGKKWQIRPAKLRIRYFRKFSKSEVRLKRRIRPGKLHIRSVLFLQILSKVSQKQLQYNFSTLYRLSVRGQCPEHVLNI